MLYLVYQYVWDNPSEWNQLNEHIGQKFWYWWDAAFLGILSGSSLFAKIMSTFKDRLSKMFLTLFRRMEFSIKLQTVMLGWFIVFSDGQSDQSS